MDPVLWYDEEHQRSPIQGSLIQWEINDMKRNYNLHGKVVAIRTLNKIPKKNDSLWWEMTDYERSFIIEKIVHVGESSFLTEEKNEHSFADIIKVF